MGPPDSYTHLPVSPVSRPPSTFNFATSVLDHWATKLPDQNALFWTSQSLDTVRKLTYAHFSRRSHRIASLLVNTLGIQPGETLIIILPRIPEWWEVVAACLRAGIVVCPCTTLLTERDVSYRLGVSSAVAFVGDQGSVQKCLGAMGKGGGERVRSVISIATDTKEHNNSQVVDFYAALGKIPKAEMFHVSKSITSTSPALMFFTSGTTGPPKMVLHSQISYPLAHALTGTHWLRLTPTPDSIYWNLSEQGWAKAAWSFFATWNCGATLFVHDDRLPFSPKRTLEVLHKFPISTLCAPPTVYRQLVLDESKRMFASKEGRPMALKHACGAGEPLNESVIRTWKQMTEGMEICDGYGQTETILICANQKDNPIKPGSMGKPIPGVPLVIVDDEGNETGTGKEGDIAVKIRIGQNGEDVGFFGIYEGYVKDTTNWKLERRIKKAKDNQLLYVTGDRATRDDDGYFWFVGRNDDVINSSGYRIGPFEVESVLKLHDSVVESAVVASPDPQREEVVKAFVVLTQSAYKEIKGDHNAESKLIKELQDFCKQHAAPYKYPRKMEFVAAEFLPKTISGKIKRAELKKIEKDKYQKTKSAKL